MLPQPVGERNLGLCFALAPLDEIVGEDNERTIAIPCMTSILGHRQSKEGTVQVVDTKVQQLALLRTVLLGRIDLELVADSISR